MGLDDEREERCLQMTLTGGRRQHTVEELERELGMPPRQVERGHGSYGLLVVLQAGQQRGGLLETSLPKPQSGEATQGGGLDG